MRKENKKVKIVGKVDSKFCKENNIEKYSNFNIVQSLGLNYHTIKHAKEFISLDSYNKTMIGINSVINNPYYKIYDPQKNSIKYYKKIIEFVCVVVNLTDTQGYVSTFYPVKKSSIDKIKYNKKKETIKN